MSRFPFEFQEIVKDCIKNGRRYRIAYTSVEHNEELNVELSIAVRILYEAFKYTIVEQFGKCVSYSDFWRVCLKNYSPAATTINLISVFELISSVFNTNKSATPLVILNLDETNSLLSTPQNCEFLRKIIQSLGSVVIENTLHFFVVCSGTHATDLYKTIESTSSIKYEDISLPLLSTNDALNIIYSLSSLDVADYPPSQHFRYTLDLLGVVGRYLELFILSLSCIGQSENSKSPTLAQKFTRGGLKKFLQDCQQKPHLVQIAIDQLVTHLKHHYFKYFKEIEETQYIRHIVPLLTAYSLFEYQVTRDTKICMQGLDPEGVYSVDTLEKMGCVH